MLSYNQLTNVKAGAAGVIKHVLRYLLAGAVNIASGFQVGGFVIRGSLAAMLQDELAVKQVHSVKGDSGTGCCLMCRNIVKCDSSKEFGHAQRARASRGARLEHIGFESSARVHSTSFSMRSNAF